MPFEIPEEKPNGRFDVLVAVGKFMASAREGFREGMERAESQRGVRICCLLTDAFLWFAGDLADEMAVEWIPYWAASDCALSTHVHTDLIRRTLGLDGMAKKPNQTINFIPGLSFVHTDYLPEGVLPEDPESSIAHMLYKMGQYLPKVTAVVVNSFEEFEPETTKHLKSKLQKVLNVGPSVFPSLPNPNFDVNSCLSWLDGHMSSSVAYISFGSMATPPPNELEALTEALRAKKMPFLWSMRDHSKGLLPKGFVEETKDFGKIVSWAPQVEVLAHPSVGVFITHCGWNSIVESITGGVPVICRPFYGDQNLNSLMVQDFWKIGIRLEGGVFSKSGTMKALESVWSGEEGKKMRENIGIQKEKAKEAMGPNGSSTANLQTLLEVIKSC